MSIFQTIINLVKWLFQTRPLSLNPDLDVRKFKEEFDLKFGSEHPSFHERSYQSAVAQAFRGPKFLLVYLHSPLHEDTNRFCRTTICSQEFSRTVNENTIFWAGSVWNPESYGLVLQLNVTVFPFMALLVCQSERTVQIADKIQGFVETRELLERLRNCMTTFGNEITRIQQGSTFRQQANLIREQQDQEFQETMEYDRKMKEKKRQEEELKSQLEEEEQQQQELEMALQLSRQLTKESQIAKKKAALSDEPADGEGITLIRFQLPRGAKVARRFKKTDKLQVVYDFLAIHFDNNNLPINNFIFGTNYPKRDLDNLEMTVEEAGLHPRGMLFVRDLDA